MELVVQIPTFNRPHELRACVEFILPVLNDEARVVEIDDASYDDEQRSYPQAISDSGGPVAVVPLIQKHGCTRARMTVLDETTADYGVILDDDAYLIPPDADIMMEVVRQFGREPRRFPWWYQPLGLSLPYTSWLVQKRARQGLRNRELLNGAAWGLRDFAREFSRALGHRRVLTRRGESAAYVCAV